MIAAASTPRPAVNVGERIARMARERPHQRAVVVAAGRRGGKPAWSHLTFANLHARSDALGRGLVEVGIGRGVRTIVLLRPTLDFFALVFAMFKVGAVPVLVDPAIGRRRLLTCLAEVEAEAFIGVPLAHVARLLFPEPFRTVKVHVTAGRRAPWGGHRLADLERPGELAIADTAPDELAAILFTSGSTGLPKGVEYTHGILDAQVDVIRGLYGFEPGEIDVATFPPFALFDPALGLTSVVPDMDPRYPARADPRRILEAVEDHGATSMFASPALLDRLSRHAAAQGERPRSLRRILTAGAPVRLDILRRSAAMLPEGAQVFTPFGATEAMPVASAGSAEVLGVAAPRTASGAGVLVGRPVSGITVRIIRITDEPIEAWSDDLLVPPGTIGEITVRGPVVTPRYFRRDEATRLAKIRDGDAVVHRMGDVGLLDPEGRLWMCGRKAHRVDTAEGTIFSVCAEGVFDQHPAVLRSALVGVGPRGAQRPVLVVEPERDAIVAGLVAELLELGSRHEVTRAVRDVRIHPGPLPVDVRHNAKIDRERLAAWAAGS